MPEAQPIVLTFRGGIRSRGREMDIAIDECTTGENFDLELDNRSLIKRRAFEKVATTPNAREIRGFAQLIKKSGAITTLVQSGDTVYSWDGATSFTSVGTVQATAKLRGPREHNFTLDDIVVITDLNLVEKVKQWDGTTFGDFTHNLGGNLFAKFARVRDERLILANVISGTATPHVLIGSALGDDNTLTITNRPSSALGFDSPFFLPTLDLKPINGLEEAFGQFVVSTRYGKLFILTGSSAFDFEFKSFYEGSAVSGDEAIVNIGNDLLLGLQNHIETLSGVISYGDVESNDISLPIANLIARVLEWRFVYDRRRQKTLCFPDTQAACWVLYKALQSPQESGPSRLSPWSKWTTTHTMAMQPSVVMALLDPTTSLDQVYGGDSLGNIYKFDADVDKDGQVNQITVKRRSGLLTVPDATLFDVKVNIDYKRQFTTTVTLRFMFSGVESSDATLTFTISADDALAVYNGAYYYGGSNGSYYSATFTGKIRRQTKHVHGRGNFMQIELEATSNGSIDIQQIEIILQAAKT